VNLRGFFAAECRKLIVVLLINVPKSGGSYKKAQKENAAMITLEIEFF